MSAAAGTSASSALDEVTQQLHRSRIVPVATLEDPSQADRLGRVLLGSGLACLEITFRTAGATQAIRDARSVEGLLVGAGTLLSPEDAERAAEAGAQFAVAPGTNEKVVSRCRQLGLPFFPGVATASEIERARDLGLRTVKVFPAAPLGGPDFIRAVSATYPDVGFIPTGGIGPDNMRDYLALPSVIACGGSWLVRPELLRRADFDEIERLCRQGAELAR